MHEQAVQFANLSMFVAGPEHIHASKRNNIYDVLKHNAAIDDFCYKHTRSRHEFAIRIFAGF